jgi:YVTN family beta-propeller protein
VLFEIVVSIFIIVLPNNISAKTLETLISESQSPSLPNIKVGERPVDVQIGHHGFIYVPNRDSQSVSVINSNTMEVSDISVEKEPGEIEIMYTDKSIRSQFRV